ncbi:unnamed protein product [Cylicocyclus nassatus]|uniref:Uncharacterized protein n=1 Tax=Cylicocyclus nassatus TaxID=53992 RepID=A0AA36DN40_CYLNA|nr:unnamed protein product [Cylicocyclus nassatus]
MLVIISSATPHTLKLSNVYTSMNILISQIRTKPIHLLDICATFTLLCVTGDRESYERLLYQTTNKDYNVNFTKKNDVVSKFLEKAFQRNTQSLWYKMQQNFFGKYTVIKMLAVFLLVVIFVETTSGEVYVNSTNENPYLLTLTVSPGIKKLYDGQLKLIENSIKSIPLPPEIYGRDTYKFLFEKKVVEIWVRELHFKSLQLPNSNDISFIDKQDGVRLQVRNLQYRLGAQVKVHTWPITATERLEVYSSSASADIDLTWTDFAFRSSTRISLRPSIRWPKAWYWQVAEKFFDKTATNIIKDNAEKQIDKKVNSAVEVLLNPILQKLKKRAKGSAIDFDRMAALQWSVQNQYLRVAVKPKSAKVFPPPMPCRKMLCVDINLRNMLLAALNPAQEVVTANDIETANSQGFTCSNPGFTCDGNYCQLASDVVISPTISTSDDWYNCLSFE